MTEVAEQPPPEAAEATRRQASFEVPIAIAIALVSLATAVGAWRTSDLDSKAGDAEREGLIETVQEQSLANEDWRRVFEEAANAQRYFAAAAEVEALEADGDEVSRAQAEALKQFLLPSLALLAGPLVSDQAYLRNDGSLDLERRYADVHAETLATDPPEPQAAYARADRIHRHHRWLVVGTVLLAGSLFWLALAEVGGERARTPALILGLLVFAAGLSWLAIVEVVFWVAGMGAT